SMFVEMESKGDLARFAIGEEFTYHSTRMQTRLATRFGASIHAACKHQRSGNTKKYRQQNIGDFLFVLGHSGGRYVGIDHANRIQNQEHNSEIDPTRSGWW